MAAARPSKPKPVTQSYFSPERATVWRIYKIDQYVRSGRYPNVPWLAEKLEVSGRTVERDISCLRDLMNAPLAYHPRKRGYYYANENFSLPGMTLTEGELIALFLGQKVLGQYRGTPFENAIAGAFTKICLALPEEVSVDFSFVDQAISFGLAPLRGEEKALLETYWTLTRAMETQRSVRMTYYTASRDTCTERRVDSYHLHFRDGAWYLIGYCHSRQDVRMFALDRIRALEITAHSYVPAPGFTIQEYLGASLALERGGPEALPVEIVLWFDSFQARYIRERMWHTSQEIIEQPDGALVLKLWLRGLGEVKRWVLSFGGHVEVLAPAQLRQEVAAEADKIRARYNGEGANIL